MTQGDEVAVDDLVTLLDEVWNGMPTRLAAAASEEDTHMGDPTQHSLRKADHWPGSERVDAQTSDRQGASPTSRFLRSLSEIAAPPRAVLRAIADGVAAVTGRGYAIPATWAGCPAGAAPDKTGLALQLPVDASPWLLGQAREVLHDRANRTSLGAWFTPTNIARDLVAAAGVEHPTSVLDPSCGGGAFLLAAHERFPGARLHGTDIDAVAVETTRAALDLAGCRAHDVRLADGLTGPDPEPVDLVVGNPPFLSQLARSTARDQERRDELTQRFGPLATRYVDDAALFVLRVARDLLRPGGTAVLVVPEALLAAGDGRALRQAVTRLCTVEVVWRDEQRAFPGTPTCAIRLHRRTRSEPATTATTSWAALLAEEVPRVTVASTQTIGDMATATADFRDAYYLLADHVEDARTPPEPGATQGHPIIPVGLIDPAHLRWGQAEVRFAKRRWQRPVAIGLPPEFLERRLGPKVLVATQTRVLEALVDEDGHLLPSTPVITLRTERPWHLAAVLTNPVTTALAARRHAGAARARGALKLSARQVLSLPTPEEGAAWDSAADTIRRAHATVDQTQRRTLVIACGQLMTEAFEVVDDELLRWWTDRLPKR